MSDALESFMKGIAAHTSLGHLKRDSAFLRQVKCLCSHPGKTGAGSCRDMASVVSAYRFAANKSVDLAELRRVRAKATLEMAAPDETLLVINDVSLLNYYNHESKEDRRAIGDGKGKGYEYVCNLAVGLESERYLGVLHDCLITAEGPDDLDQIDYHAKPLFAPLSQQAPSRLECNHKHILDSHVGHISHMAPQRNIVYVADREFDDYFVFDTVVRARDDVVIRSNATRNVQVDEALGWLPKENHTVKYAGLRRAEGHACCGMKNLVKHVPLKPFKSLALDGKGRLCDPRVARSTADVSVGHFKVKLYRNAKRNKTYFPISEYVELNVVVVRETQPPPGRTPIEWILYTTLPVETEEQLRRVVRIYELRWLVENFFKYLKSGFAIEDLRYNNARKTAIHLVALTIAVSFLCNLKTEVGLPRTGLIPAEDYPRVKEAAKKPNDASIDTRLRLFALLAVQGGWRGRKGDPISPLTLIKGFGIIQTLLDVFEAAPGLLEEMSKRRREGG